MTFFKRFFLFSLLILLSIFSSFAQNTGEVSPTENPEKKNLSLSEIDALISSSNYNEALKSLTLYMKEHPNDFDRAQKRVDRVLKARNAFNKNAEKLVDMIKSGEGDQIQKLEKITLLEKSEVDPTETVSEFTALARRTVALGDVLIAYNRIMHQGLRLVEAGQYADAALKFEEGFLIKNEFSDIVFEQSDALEENGDASESEGILVEYESDIIDGVNEAIKKIKEADEGTLLLPGFKAVESECESSYAEFIRNVRNKNFDGAEKSFEKVRASFKKLADLRNSVMAQSRILDEFDALANERNPLLMGTSYITFYQRFVLGDETNANTGVIGAMDAFWNTRVESMKSNINEAIYSTLSNIQKELPEAEIFQKAATISRQQKNLALAENFSLLAVKVQDLYLLPENFDGTPVGKDFKDYEDSMLFVKDYLADLILSYSSSERIAAEEKHEIKSGETSGRIDDEAFSESLMSINRYEKIKEDSKDYLIRVNAEKEREDAYFLEKQRRAQEEARLEKEESVDGMNSPRKRQTAGAEVSDETADFRNAISYFISVNNQNTLRAEDHIKNLWAFLAQLYLHNGNVSYDMLFDDFSKAQKLLDGETDGNLVKKYPREAGEKSREISSGIAETKSYLLESKERLDGGKRFKGVSAEYDSSLSGIDELIKKLDGLALKNSELAKKADSQIRLASIASDEGKNQYEKALLSFNKNDFSSANAAIDAASEKFAQSLDYQFDEEILALREEKLAALASQILAAENEKVIRDVFALKEKASSYYYSSDFDSAENTLVQAQSLLSSVNAESDPEIEELLASVKNIKSLEFGRVLLSSDPHYPELSNSLNMARLSFERGVSFKKQGKSEDALEAFNVAQTNIRNVQNVYPLNKEARLINLQIQQELDPQGFPALFEKQYRDAKLNSTLNERLADLQDLYAINPKYPGLSKEIYDLEETLGMHPKKVVKSDAKKRAEEALREAKALFRDAGSDDEKLSQALAKVNQAILLDSTNSEAKNVKLSIQLKIGNQTTAILSQSDEKLYAEAGRLFNQRKFEEANAVMNELWKSSAAKKSRKVIDLRNRIARRL